MDREIFTRQLDRLADCFGDKNYNKDRIMLIWNEVCSLRNEWLVKVVDNFVGCFRQAPLVPEFREEVAKERERLWQIQKREQRDDIPDISAWVCNDCTNSGIVFNEENCVFKCHCSHGSKRPENYPIMLRSKFRTVNQ